MSASSVAPQAAAATANAAPAGLMAARAAQHGGAAGQSVFAAVLQELASDAQSPAPEGVKSSKDNAPKSGAAKDGAARDKPDDPPEAKTGQSADAAAAIAALVAPQPDAATSAAAVAALIAPRLAANASAAATASAAPAASPPLSNGMARAAAAPRSDIQANAPTPGAAATQAWAARLQAQGQPAAAAGALMPLMPSDSTAQLALAAPPSLAPPVVDVHVQRARTYLGVDGATQAAKVDSVALASAGSDPAKNAKPSPSAAALAAPPAKANGGEQAGDSAMRREGSNDARNGAGDQNSREIPTAATSAPAVSDPGLVSGAVAAAPVSLDQLPDLIAQQAETMTAPAAAANTSAPAASQNPVKELEVQLNPADLGSLTVKMRLANGNLAVVIETSKDSTAKLIEGERDAIAERLASVEQPVASVVIQASDSVPNQGGDNNGPGSATPQQGDAQSSAANSSNGQAHSAPRDDRPARQANPAEDEASRRARSGDLFV
ncbi:MAG TPA: flagellar hook-length control protein FliK [Roseiarcus sp.]|nr:flagellar hook-length control protein FliK [Roseiarcus sp.]